MIEFRGLKLSHVLRDIVKALFPEINEGRHDAVYRALLYRRERFAKCHSNGRGAQDLQSPHEIIRLCGAQFQPLEVFGSLNGMFAVADRIGTGAVPEQGFYTRGLLKLRVEFFPHVALDNRHGLIHIIEHVGEIQDRGTPCFNRAVLRHT